MLVTNFIISIFLRYFLDTHNFETYSFKKSASRTDMSFSRSVTSSDVHSLAGVPSGMVLKNYEKRDEVSYVRNILQRATGSTTLVLSSLADQSSRFKRESVYLTYTVFVCTHVVGMYVLTENLFFTIIVFSLRDDKNHSTQMQHPTMILSLLTMISREMGPIPLCE